MGNPVDDPQAPAAAYQKPLPELFATPPTDKKLSVCDGAHAVGVLFVTDLLPVPGPALATVAAALGIGCLNRRQTAGKLRMDAETTHGFRLRIYSNKWANFAGWFLLVTYTLGALVFAFLEFSGNVMSARFDYPPALIYLVSAIQIPCAIALLFPRLILPSLAVFTALSLGAVASHFRIGSPMTSLPAIAYTVIQVWLAYRIWSAAASARNDQRQGKG
jgi:hypothetical protein